MGGYEPKERATVWIGGHDMRNQGIVIELDLEQRAPLGVNRIELIS